MRNWGSHGAARAAPPWLVKRKSPLSCDHRAFAVNLEPCSPSSPLWTLNSSHLLPCDSESVSSQFPQLPCSPKATSPPSPALSRQKDQATSWPQSQPRVRLEILPGGLVEMISSQDQFLLPGVIPPKLTYKSPTCCHAARTCGTEKQFDIAGTLTVGPMPVPLQQGSCPLTQYT